MYAFYCSQVKAQGVFLAVIWAAIQVYYQKIASEQYALRAVPST